MSGTGVAQSGKSTAVGLYIENLWRNPPLTGAGAAKTLGKASALTQAYTDLASVTPFTAVTSVARPFISGDVGSVLVITSGTGFLPGRYTVLSVAGGAATLTQDGINAVACATVTASAGVGNLNVVGNPGRFFIVRPGGGFSAKPTLDVKNDDIDGVFGLKRTILTGKSYAGSYSLDADPENLQYLLMGIFGKDVQTTAQTSPVTVYKHVFTFNAKGYQPAFTCEELFGDHTIGRLSSGVLLSDVEIDFTDTVGAKLTATPYRQVPNQYPDAGGTLNDYSYGAASMVIPAQMGGDGTMTLTRTAAPTYIDVAAATSGNGPLVWAGLTFGSETGFSTGYLTVDGTLVPVELMKGLSLALSRAIESEQIAGSGYDMGACIANAFSVSGKGLSILFQDTQILLATLKKSRIGLNFLIPGVIVGATGQKYAMEVYLPRCRFTESGLDVPATKMMVGGSFVAEIDPSLGYECKITLWNTFDNTVVGGEAALLPQGLGGWSAQ